jgi:N6-adenosine-specific RNA methylase IME4
MTANRLTHYDAACREIAAACSIDEVKPLRDKAEALRHYARQAKNREMEVQATEIRIRAERRLGQIIKAQKETVGLNQGAVRGKTGTKARPVLDDRPTLAAAGIDKKLSSRAQEMAKVPEAKFEGMLGKWRERSERESERVTVDLLRGDDKAERRADRERALAGKIIALPDRRYGVIVADPEWAWEPWSRETGMDRAADNHYPTSVTAVIAARDVPSIAARDCVLFLWATIPMLPHALLVMGAWGFDYQSHYVWVKDKIGLGFWSREKHEILLIGTRGKVPAPAPGTQNDSVILAPRGRHSEKPEAALQMIERYYPNVPKIELNRRGPARAGWDAWGDEVVAAAE